MKALKITTSNEMEVIDIENDCKAIQEALGGRFEVVHLPTPDDLMLVDEEGRLKDKPVNKLASVLAQREDIVGDALLVTERGEEFGDVDPGLVMVVDQLLYALKGRQLHKYNGSPCIRINDTPVGSKEKELAIRARFHEGDEMDELQKMISVCEDELISGVPFHREDLFMYCVAMNNLIEILLMQMTDNQKALYRKLSERCKVTAFVLGEGCKPS